MIANNLQNVAEQVVRRARRQGHVVPREVREELGKAGLADSLWKDVLALARPSLLYRQGHYHYASPESPRVRREKSNREHIRRVVRRLIRQHRASPPAERRKQDRIDFIHPVRVIAEGTEHNLLSRDLSPTGIRLIGTCRLLGQKVRVIIPTPDGSANWTFLVHILWTCPVADGLVENGGAILATTEGMRDSSEG